MHADRSSVDRTLLSRKLLSHIYILSYHCSYNSTTQQWYYWHCTYRVGLADKRTSLGHHLDLASNLLGEAIPFEIGNMVQLRKSHRLIHNYQSIHTDLISLYYHVGNLDLGVNAFRGAIPPQVAALPHLEQLRLRENRLTGTIPIELLDSGRMRTYF